MSCPTISRQPGNFCIRCCRRGWGLWDPGAVQALCLEQEVSAFGLSMRSIRRGHASCILFALLGPRLLWLPAFVVFPDRSQTLEASPDLTQVPHSKKNVLRVLVLSPLPHLRSKCLSCDPGPGHSLNHGHPGFPHENGPNHKVHNHDRGFSVWVANSSCLGQAPGRLVLSAVGNDLPRHLRSSYPAAQWTGKTLCRRFLDQRPTRRQREGRQYCLDSADWHGKSITYCSSVAMIPSPSRSTSHAPKTAGTQITPDSTTNPHS